MPAPHNTPGYVSFSDYLDANQGSLAQERQGALTAADAAGQQAQTDLSGLSSAAYSAGQSAGAAAPNPAQYLASQYGAPVEATQAPQAAPAHIPGDFSYLPGYSQFQTDRTKADEALGTLTGASISGKSAWESGLMGADSGYASAAKGLQDKYAGAMSGYLDTLGAQAQSGYSAGAATRTPTATYYDATPQPDPEHEGPTTKPRRTRAGVKTGDLPP